MDLEHLIKKISDEAKDGDDRLSFPEIRPIEDVAASFMRQESEIDGVEFEYIWQLNDQFDSYRGELTVPFGDGKKCLVWYFCG